MSSETRYRVIVGKLTSRRGARHAEPTRRRPRSGRPVRRRRGRRRHEARGERRDSDGCSLREAMAAHGRDLERVAAARAVDETAAYLELHIEQGPVLERAGVDLGIVTAITGLVTFRARLRGEANHAGTTPM